jgi:4-amino-4-deoxy-L-arabinose transferase-like glycosyltransferase
MSQPEPTSAQSSPEGASPSSPREPAFFSSLALKARWCSSWQAGVLLVVLSLCTLLPGLFTIPPIDRDESRFAQASRQMLQSGNFVVPMVQDRPRLNKPPLIYWLQSASAASALAVHGYAGDTSRDAIWMYRLPSVLAALASVVLTWRLGLRMLDARAAFIGAAALALCPVLIVDAHQARADQVLVAFTIAAMLMLWRVLHEEPTRRGAARRIDAARVAAMPAQAKQALAANLVSERGSPFRPAWWGLWLLVGLGILTKGPITPMVVVLCVLAHCALLRTWGPWKLAKPLLGMLLALACVLPWVVLVAMQAGPGVYFQTIVDETIGRSLEPKEGHWGPPGYHLLLLTPLLFPITMVVGVAVVDALRDGLARAQPATTLVARLTAFKPWQADKARLFLIAWALPAFVVFEFVSTKLPHYPLPTYAAFALLGARAALSLTGARPAGLVRVGYILWAVVGCVGLAAACLALSSVLELPTFAKAIGTVVGGAALGLLLSAGVMACMGRMLRALLFAGVATGLALSTILGVLLPNAQGDTTPWIARNAAQALLRHERELLAARAVGTTDSTTDAKKPSEEPLGAEVHAEPPPPIAVPLACCVFNEDSLIFLTHGRIQRVSVPAAASPADTRTPTQLAAAEVASWLAANPTGLMLTTTEVAELAKQSTPAIALNTLRGFNHPRGKLVSLTILRAAPPSSP